MREHLRECVSGWGGVKSQNVGCGGQRVLLSCAFKQAVPSTTDLRKGSLHPIVLQHLHTQRTHPQTPHKYSDKVNLPVLQTLANYQIMMLGAVVCSRTATQASEVHLLLS